VGSTPYLGGGFGHFYAYAPDKWQYPIDRFAMETKRQLDVLDRNLATRRYITGDDYSIADMAIFPWYGGLLLQNLYGAAEFLETASYRNVLRWANELAARPAVKRGMRVNRTKEPDAVRERHDAGDLDVPGSAAAT
jgi:GST-like protein